jgi:hypothetical protein
MRMKVTPDAALFTEEELRLRDPDAFVLLELCHFDHCESVFEWRDEMRRDMPGGSWSDERFYGALSRLITNGFMVAVRETIQ